MANTKSQTKRTANGDEPIFDPGDIARVISESVDASVRAGVQMAKIPLSLCAGICGAWADALDKIVERPERP